MGLDSGSTSDRHRASNPTTTSTFDTPGRFVPFVIELWISASWVAVSLIPMNSSGPHGGGVGV